MIRRIRSSIILSVMVLTLPLSPASSIAQSVSGSPFRVEEASITDIQSAIKSGQTTCKQVVQAYIDRAKAYNGICTALVTEDGAPIPPSTGMVRAGSPIKYPTQTVAVSTVFPDLDQYEGLPIEFGRMEPTISDPSVQQQCGMRVGIPNAGQLNALETLNIRGERSVTCKGDFDKAPSAGPLPAGAPAVCEEFRKLPDALERAAELDKQYGTQPRSGEAADVLRGLLAQELVRREGHARHRRQRCELRDGRAEGRLARHRRPARQGRHHLRDRHGETT